MHKFIVCHCSYKIFANHSKGLGKMFIKTQFIIFMKIKNYEKPRIN